MYVQLMIYTAQPSLIMLVTMICTSILRPHLLTIPTTAAIIKLQNSVNLPYAIHIMKHQITSDKHTCTHIPIFYNFKKRGMHQPKVGSSGLKMLEIRSSNTPTYCLNLLIHARSYKHTWIPKILIITFSPILIVV